MRFDDTLKTVLAADCSTPFGAQAAWRQLVDLLGRGADPLGTAAIDRLRALRPRVPQGVRLASALGLEHAHPSESLITFFIEDDLTVSAALLRGMRLDSAGWCGLLPLLGPGQRAVLRNRRDLDDTVVRALASFGSIDFVLDDASGERMTPVVPQAVPIDDGAHRPTEASDPVEQPVGPFRIADVVARIDAHRGVQNGRIERRSRHRARDDVAQFRFETDAAGLVRWTDGTDRAPLIGLSIARPSPLAQTDGGVIGAFRQRASFRDARLEIGGTSAIAGQWRVSGVPVFDPRSGRFTGYRGNARRPRAEEATPRPAIEADSLRQLVHELRTPANAIAGFAEMIDTQLLGPVPDVYRGYAAAIRQNIGDLLGAIDDLDLAARIEGSALSLASGRVTLRATIERIVGELGPLAALHGAHVLIDRGDAVVRADPRAIERLLSRMIATILAASARDEEIAIGIDAGEEHAAVAIDLPLALLGRSLATLCAIEDEVTDGTLLGTGFAFRLVTNLARELGGSLVVSATGLTVSLPVAEGTAMERATPEQL